MAIEANTPNDWGMRGATNTTLSQFQGKPRQLVVNIDDGYRPIIMDGTTLGGKFKCASSDELTSGLATKLGKSEKAESAKVADSANSVAGKNVTGTVANATNAVNAQNAINANHATSADTATTANTALSIEGANVTGTVTNATSAVNATNASSVPWTGITNKPSFAAVATSGSYNDLKDKPNIPSAQKAYITETWRSGSNWYRRYSDGWIEQGGKALKRPISVRVTLPKSFSSINFTAVISVVGARTTNTFSVYEKTPNSINFYTGTSESEYDFEYIACGY